MKKKSLGKSMLMLNVIILFTLLGVLSMMKNVYACDTATYTVSGVKNYLALRSEASYNDSNEIGRLYNGDTVEVYSMNNGQYCWVYSSKLQKEGYVNKDYLTVKSDNTVYTYRATGMKHYLALRSSARYDDNNEIGRIYEGETVTVRAGDRNSGQQYWYVTSSKLGMSGYVDKDYLR